MGNYSIGTEVIELQGQLRGGLRPSSDVPMNSPFCKWYTRMKVSPYGAIEPETRTNPTDHVPTLNFPYPMLWRGNRYAHIFDETDLYALDESVTPWAATLQTLYDAEDLTDNTATIPVGKAGGWHVGGVGEQFVATNGNCFVFKMGLTNLGGWRAAVGTAQTCNTVVLHNERVWMGGFAVGGALYWWAANWTSLMEAWRNSPQSKEFWGSDSAFKPGAMLFWGKYRGGALTKPCALMISALGYHMDPAQDAFDLLRAHLLTAVRNGSIGFLQMRWRGDILKTESLGQNLIVYGENGITAVTPEMERVEIAQFGIIGRGAAAGGVKGHVFVDGDQNLWRLEPDLSLHFLDYKEYLDGTPALDGETVVCWDEALDEFYIADVDLGFGYNKNGLYRISKWPVSCFRAGGHEMIGWDFVPILPLGYKFIESCEFFTRDYDTIHKIQIESRDPDHWEIMVGYKDATDAGLSYTAYTVPDERGEVEVNASGVAFAVVVRSNSVGNDNIGNIRAFMASGQKIDLQRRIA